MKNNVIMGSWHTVISTRESSWIIVENRDAHLDDTEMRPLTEAELQAFHEQLPELAFESYGKTRETII
jgi:hypothetical protein